MINPIAFLNKPTYLFRPSQVWSRCFRPRGGLAEVKLSWGGAILCNTEEDIGRKIHDQGIYDLVVSETLYRLLPQRGVGVDVGANIGHMTGLMAKKAGRGGRVISFEPSSRIRETLLKNVDRWSRTSSAMAEISVSGKAVSDSEGHAQIYYPGRFASNEGIASLDSQWSGGGNGPREEVETTTLDREFGDGAVISVLKVDVEGHELPVFKGAQRLLAGKKITHIVFEDLKCGGIIQSFLEGFGYEVYRLARSLTRVRLFSPDDRSRLPVDVLPNFLATLDPQGAQDVFAERGWMTLRG